MRQRLGFLQLVAFVSGRLRLKVDALLAVLLAQNHQPKACAGTISPKLGNQLHTFCILSWVTIFFKFLKGISVVSPSLAMK